MGRLKIKNKFKPLITSEADYFIVIGGRGSGKSFSVSLILLLLLRQVYQTILFCRYTMSSAHISVIPEFTEKIELLQWESILKVNKTDITNIETNSNILFRGIKTSSGNQTASLKSIQNVSTFVLDEAEELIDEATFDKIDNSVRNNKVKNRIVLILNPTTKEHWIYKRFFEGKGVKEGFNGTKDNVCYIHTTYLDNVDNLSSKFLNSAEHLKQTNPAKYNHIMLGGWLDKAEGVIYENWSYGEFDESLPYQYGMDFGFFPDPDVLAKVAIDNKRKKVYVKQELKLNHAGVQKLSNEIKSVINLEKSIIADSAEPRLINDLQSKGIKVRAVKKGAGSILAGIKLLQDYELIIEPNSIDIGKELNNYVWSDKKNGVPVDAYNHWLDAIRYVVSTVVNPIKPPKTRMLRR